MRARRCRRLGCPLWVLTDGQRRLHAEPDGVQEGADAGDAAVVTSLHRQHGGLSVAFRRCIRDAVGTSNAVND